MRYLRLMALLATLTRMSLYTAPGAGTGTGGGNTGTGAGGSGTGTGGGQNGSQTGGTGGTGATGGQATGGGAEGQQGGAQGGADGGGTDRTDTLPKWARDQITQANNQAAAERVKRTELLTTVAKALGIETVDGKPDAAKLAEQAAAQHRALAGQLAVERAARIHSADPDRLLDSRTFAAKLDQLDPAAADYGQQVQTLVVEQVQANPWFKAGDSGTGQGQQGGQQQGTQNGQTGGTGGQQGSSTTGGQAPPARSGGEITPGTGTPKQLTANDIQSMTPEQIVEAREKGLLAGLLSGA